MPRKKPDQMQRPQLSDLNGLRVCLLLPPSSETHLLEAHLKRIGCVAVATWPIADVLPDDIDVIIITVEPEYREAISRFSHSLDELGPPVIVVAEYEDPSTLQLVLEIRAVAVIERPIKPFGLLTNLMIARDVWSRRQDSDRLVREARSEHLGMSKIAVAKVLLAQQNDISEHDAHKRLQKMAMDSRQSMETVAENIISEGAPEGLVNALSKFAQ